MKGKTIEKIEDKRWYDKINVISVLYLFLFLWGLFLMIGTIVETKKLHDIGEEFGFASEEIVEACAAGDEISCLQEIDVNIFMMIFLLVLWKFQWLGIFLMILAALGHSMYKMSCRIKELEKKVKK